MKKINKTVAVLLTVSMLMSLGACQDKSMDEVLDLAEDVANYTCDRDYKKLSKLTEDGDEKLEEIFEGIEEDDFREVVASTLTFEFDEDSLEKKGKTGYSVEVTFSYVNYAEVLEDEDVVTLSEFEDAVDDCDEMIEESVTLEFQKDGSDLIFVNIEDLEDLFPYWDEDLTPDMTGGTSGDLTVNPARPDDATGESEIVESETETSETEFDWDSYELGGLWNDDRYPDPAPYYEDGVTYLLPNTAILFTVPADAPVSSLDDNGIDSPFFMLGGYWGNTYEDYYSIVDGQPYSCTNSEVLERRYESIDMFSESEPGYVSHELTTLDVTYHGVTYEGVLSTITRANGEIVYRFVVIIGNDDFYYIINIRTRNMDDITSFGDNFSIVEY